MHAKNSGCLIGQLPPPLVAISSPFDLIRKYPASALFCKILLTFFAVNNHRPACLSSVSITILAFISKVSPMLPSSTAILPTSS